MKAKTADEGETQAEKKAQLRASPTFNRFAPDEYQK